MIAIEFMSITDAVQRACRAAVRQAMCLGDEDNGRTEAAAIAYLTGLVEQAGKPREFEYDSWTFALEERRKGEERRKCQESMPHELLGSPGHYSCRHCSRFWSIDSVHWLKQCPARDRRKGQRRGGTRP